MMKRTLALAGALVVALATPALADWYGHEEGGVELDVPLDWQVQPGNDTGLLVAENASSKLAIVLWVSDDTWEGALTALDTELETIIEFPSLDSDPIDGALNGMLVHRRSGTGAIAGETVQWQLTLVQGEKPVMVLAFAVPGAWSSEVESIDRIVGTLRKLN